MIRLLRERGLLAEVEAVAKAHCATVDEILGPRRFKSIVSARRATAMMLREKGLSYPQIGTLLGGRDHTTIMALCKAKPRCVCGGHFNDHLARPPHAWPTRGCVGFAIANANTERAA